MLRAREARRGSDALRGFTQELLPFGATLAVAIARPGSERKVKVFLADSDERLVGFLKYGESPVARARIRHEHRTLERLPPSLGPTPLCCDAFARGDALLVTPVEGRPMKPTRRPTPEQERVLESLAGPCRAIEEHPWIAALRRRASQPIDAWLEPLATRRWPVVVQHGDFAPWNLLRDPRSGQVRAVDWELAALEGFPYLDLVYFILQTSALVYRSSPRRAWRRALRYLQRAADLPEAQAASIVRLAAYDAYLTTAEGGDLSGPLQAWRRSLWRTS